MRLSEMRNIVAIQLIWAGMESGLSGAAGENGAVLEEMLCKFPVVQNRIVQFALPRLCKLPTGRRDNGLGRRGVVASRLHFAGWPTA